MYGTNYLIRAILLGVWKDYLSCRKYNLRKLWAKEQNNSLTKMGPIRGFCSITTKNIVDKNGYIWFSFLYFRIQSAWTAIKLAETDLWHSSSSNVTSRLWRMKAGCGLISQYSPSLYLAMFGCYFRNKIGSPPITQQYAPSRRCYNALSNVNYTVKQALSSSRSASQMKITLQKSSLTEMVDGCLRDKTSMLTFSRDHGSVTI